MIPQGSEPHEVTKPNFQLIAEGIDTGLDFESRFRALADLSALYRCDYYADLSDIHEPEAAAYYDFQSKHSYRQGDLAPAPYEDNFRLGVELIKSWVRERRLDLPANTEVFDQLSRITHPDLAGPRVRGRFFAVEALRHVVSGYRRDPAIKPQLHYMGNYSHYSQGWML